MCYNFELLNIQVPIISAYEVVESKVYQGILAKFRKPQQVVIVPQSRCVIGSRDEVLVGISQDHGSICKVEVGEDLYTRISGALQRVLRDAPSLIYEKFHTSSRDPGEMATIRSQTTEEARGRATMMTSEPTGGKSPDFSRQYLSSTRDATYGSSKSPRSTDGGDRMLNFEVVRKDPRLPCFAMRTHKRKNNFVGRDKILSLIDRSLLPDNQKAVAPGQASVRSFALCGMGGIGKTQIAVEYAYSRKTKYDAVLWIAADDKDIMSEEFARVAADLGLAEQNEIKDLTSAVELVKGWLSNPVRSYDAPTLASNEASWLLIFDNVDNLDVLEEFWPMTGHGAVLTTSRNSLAKNQTYTANQGIDLQPLSSMEAVEFMNSLTGMSSRSVMIDGGQDAAEVVTKLGCLPLLITQMAGVMSRLGLSYPDFLMLCNESGIQRVGMAGSVTSMSEQMFSVSYQLGLDGLTPKCLGLLSLMSMLDPDRIPERILTSACNISTPAHFPKGLEQYFKSRAQLLQTSLISHNPDTRDVWIHRVVQDVVREKMDKDQLAEMYDMAINAVSKVWPFSNLETRFFTGRYKDCASLFPCIVRLKNAYASVDTLQTFEEKVSSATLFNDAGWYWFERGFQEESMEWYELVEYICNGLTGNSREDVAYLLRETHHNQGTTAGETNDTARFLKHTHIWLDMVLQRRTGNGDVVVDYELCMSYNETGVAHAMNREYEVAITYFLKAIESFQSLPHYQDTMLGWTESNIGLMYWMLGNYDDAEAVLLEIIDIYQTSFGYDDTNSFKTGKMLYALGNVYVSKGEFDKGLEYHTRCLKQYRATLGDTHHRIGDVCVRLADDNVRFDSIPAARTLINQALKVFSNRPRYRQELARAKFKAAQISRAEGKPLQAAAELQEAYLLRRSLNPQDKRGMNELEEVDYDDLVVFWSR